MGSRAFSAVSRSTLFLQADPEIARLYLLHIKNNVGPQAPTLECSISDAVAGLDDAGEEVHAPRVEWLGRITEADKMARLRSASVFCAPSLHGESFGVVLVEAMAAGTPVVASSLDGYRNVATDELDALLVEPGDATALAAALARVLGDRTLSEALVTQGNLRADAFAMSALAREYVAIYRRLADGPPA